MRTLDILVPRYKEKFDIIKPLLDSIEIQQNVDFNEIGVIITDDGDMDRLDTNELSKYSYRIEYLQNEHMGVSATRNYCLDHSTAEYVMFCDCDDMFFSTCGLYIVFREIKNGGFDSLVAAFIEETRDPTTKEPVYVNHEMDSTFVHSKIHKRKYLVDNNIRWNDALTIHEDSFFNCLSQKLSADVKYCPTAFYLWRWRDDSVCRHDPKYILKTYNNMLDSNTALVNEFLQRGKTAEAQYFACNMIYDAYYTMNKDEWLNQQNQDYRIATERRFKKYYADFKCLIDNIDMQIKAQIIMGQKNRFFGEGLLMESVTFDSWIKHIEQDY